MKTMTLVLTLILAGFLMIESLQAQERTTDRLWDSPNAAVEQQIGLTAISITYGRPSVNDREIFGGLEPFGEVWRTGANESTAITFSDDVLIEGEEVEAGTYSLYTVPGEDGWTIIINEILSWGTEYDESGDVLRVDVEAEEAPHMEQFMIYFQNINSEEGELVLHWDETKVPVTISVTD